MKEWITPDEIRENGPPVIGSGQTVDQIANREMKNLERKNDEK